MSEETIIGPQRCHQCGGEYGEHDSGCAESKEHKELTRLRAELTQAKADADDWWAFANVMEGARDALKDEAERLRAALLKQSHESEGELCWCHTPVCTHQPACKAAREALATPSAEPVVPTLQEDPHWITMQTCMHHNDSQRKRAGCPVCLMNDAEALETALQGHSHAFMSPGLEDQCPMCAALAAYRAKHPEPAWLKGILDDVRAKHPPAEAKEPLP